jgi:hypothetical protein
MPLHDWRWLVHTLLLPLRTCAAAFAASVVERAGSRFGVNSAEDEVDSNTGEGEESIRMPVYNQEELDIFQHTSIWSQCNTIWCS